MNDSSRMNTIIIVISILTLIFVMKLNSRYATIEQQQQKILVIMDTLKPVNK